MKPYINNFLSKLFRKPRYELKCLSAHEDYINNKLLEAMNDGWEMCGNVSLEYFPSYIFVRVPMRRKINR